MMELRALEDLAEPDDETYLSRMRHQRDRLLAASDWAMTSDAPTDKQAWAVYRQALRDFPASWVPGPVADFPEPPKPVVL